MLFFITVLAYVLFKIEILEKKKPWLMFDEQRQIALDLKNERQAINDKYEAAEREKAPFVQKIKYGDRFMILLFAN